MPYWNGDLDGCDFAFDSVGAVVLQTMNRLEAEANLVIDKKHPEQSMLALLKVLDLLTDQFPRCVAVHFRKRRYLAIKDRYISWLESFAAIPREHSLEFDANATALFESLDRKLKIGGQDDLNRAT